MGKTLSTAVAAAALLSGAFAQRATATTFMSAGMSNVDAVRTAVIKPVVNVCGTHGCVPVQTKRVIHHQKPGNTVPHRI